MAFRLENISFQPDEALFFRERENSEKKMQELESILAWQMISCNSAAVLPRVFALASQESSCRLNSGPTMHASLSAFCFLFFFFTNRHMSLVPLLRSPDCFAHSYRLTPEGMSVP